MGEIIIERKSDLLLIANGLSDLKIRITVLLSLTICLAKDGDTIAKQ